MVKKKITKIAPINYVLPSENKELQYFSQKFKVEMMEQVVDSIEYAHHNRLSFVEVFQFKNSDFVITLSEKDYLTNLDNILNFYLKNESYEYCPRVTELQKSLQKKSNDEKQNC